MTAENGGNLSEQTISRAEPSAETISKIRKFASEHSDGIEDAGRLQNVLEELVPRIVSYCRTGEKFSGSGRTDKVEVYVVSAQECLSVSIKVSDREFRERFERGIPQEEAEKLFLRLLGFREFSEAEIT